MGKYYGSKMQSKKNESVGSGKMFAGLPQGEMMKAYPKANYGAKEGYPDNQGAVDSIAAQNHKKMK